VQITELLRNKKYLQGTVKTEIIETGARTSRISSFRLGGENTARKILQPSAETTHLTRRGNSNVLAPVSIISVFTVFLRARTLRGTSATSNGSRRRWW